VSDARPKRQFGNYEIMSLIGRGGMAEVFRARPLTGARANQVVALKRLLPELAKDPTYVDLFAGEADLSKFLDHPNIVKIYEVGVIRDVYFMVMELIDGRDLARVLRKCKQRNLPLPVDFALYIQRTLLDALVYAHSATGPSGKPLEIVHGDVSPSNVFISRLGDIKLGDFGSARVRGVASEAGVIAGKPYYLSPAMLEGTVTTEADVWAATVSLYELLTLERPFAGSTQEEVFAAIRERSYRPVHELRPDIPRAIEALVDRGFSSLTDERFGSAQEFASELDGLYDPNVGTPLGIASVVRGLFGADDAG
jgi:serine/threonine protein kinase